MKIEKECNCCGALYSIRFDLISNDLDPEQDTNANDGDEFYPEFCPFCGSHESEEDTIEDD